MRNKITKKVGKYLIELDCTSNGMTIWVNGTWVLDASCFMDDMCIVVSEKRLRKVKKDPWQHTLYKFDKRCV